jgi:hypothetical protein
MSGKMAFVALAVTATMVVLGTPSAAWAGYDYDREGREGPHVKPCSLAGVNPVYHPEIFGKPAFAKAHYGFVQGRDHTWHVIPNCAKPAFIGPY